MRLWASLDFPPVGQLLEEVLLVFAAATHSQAGVFMALRGEIVDTRNTARLRHRVHQVTLDRSGSLTEILKPGAWPERFAAALGWHATLEPLSPMETGEETLPVDPGQLPAPSNRGPLAWSDASDVAPAAPLPIQLPEGWAESVAALEEALRALPALPDLRARALIDPERRRVGQARRARGQLAEDLGQLAKWATLPSSPPETLARLASALAIAGELGIGPPDPG
jgi:hypothetical protein